MRSPRVATQLRHLTAKLIQLLTQSKDQVEVLDGPAERVAGHLTDPALTRLRLAEKRLRLAEERLLLTEALHNLDRLVEDGAFRRQDRQKLPEHPAALRQGDIRLRLEIHIPNVGADPAA